jgi:hypothetical protein
VGVGGRNSPSAARSRELEARALELRIGRATYAEIGAELGVTSKSAHRIVARTLDRTRAVTAERAEVLRDLDLAQLDRIERRMLAALDDDDHDVAARASLVILRVLERRAALTGIDARADDGTQAEVDAAIERLALRLRPPAQPHDVIDVAAIPAEVPSNGG